MELLAELHVKAQLRDAAGKPDDWRCHQCGTVYLDGCSYICHALEEHELFSEMITIQDDHTAAWKCLCGTEGFSLFNFMTHIAMHGGAFKHLEPFLLDNHGSS